MTLSAAGLALPQAASAQVGAGQSASDQSSAETETVRIGTLRIAGHEGREESGEASGADRVYSAPASSVHITHEDLSRFTALSPADVLRGQPGINLGDSRNGGAIDVNIRGLQGQGRVAVTVDGSQQALSVYRGYGGSQERTYIDPDLISSITVNKGAQTASALGGAIGGTVAMNTLTAEDILTEGQDFGVRLTGSLWDNGLMAPRRNHDPKQDLGAVPRGERDNLLRSEAEAGSLALALRRDRFDIIAAVAGRNQGNYLAGTKGRDRYRLFDADGDEQNSVANIYADGEEVLNTSNHSRSLLLKTQIRPMEGHTLDLAYRHYQADIAEIMPSDIFRSGTAGITQYPAGEVDTTALTARYHYSPAENPLINLSANLWWNDTASSQLNSVRAPRSERFVTDRAWTRVDNERIGGDISNTSTFTTDRGVFKLLLGAAFQTEDLRPQDRVVITQEDLNANRIGRNGKREEYSLYGQLDYQFNEDLSVWLGARYSHFSSRDRNRISTAVREEQMGRFITVFGEKGWGNLFWRPDANGQYTAATDPRLNNSVVFTDTNHPFEGIRYNDFGVTSTRVFAPGQVNMVVGYNFSQPLEMQDDAFSPSVGIQYRLGDSSLIYASYTEASRMPSLFETTLGTLQVEPNGNLKPERARQIEVGFSTERESLFTPGDRAAFKLVYFNNNIRDFVSRYYDPSTFGGMTFTNADSYKVDGLELQAFYDDGRFFGDLSATHHFKAETCDADFAQLLRDQANEYMKTEDTPDCTPGSYMGAYTNTQNPPEYSINLNLGMRLFDERLILGSRAVHTSQPTETIDKPWQTGATTPQIFYEAVTVVDAYARYELMDNLHLNASVQNIGDRYYLDPLAQSFMPAPGRTVRLGLTAKF